MNIPEMIMTILITIGIGNSQNIKVLNIMS